MPFLDLKSEFISDQFQQAMDFHDVVLHHIPVGAPWMNGVAERAGGALKTVMRAVIHSQSAIGYDDVSCAVNAALETVNGDINNTGYSPAQLVLGKQPRSAGVNRERRRDPASPLLPHEVKQLKGILGSLQWLAGQTRFDLGFAVSSLQSEKPTIGTLLRANKCVVEAKRNGDFAL